MPYSFEVEALKLYITQNLTQCRKVAQKYITDQLHYDEALETLQKVLPGVQVTKKSEKDSNLDMESQGLAVKHLIKYVKTPKEETRVDRQEMLRVIVEEAG